MTELRRRFLDDMTLHGLAPSTHEVYLNAVAQLAAYYGRSPDQLSEQELRDYFGQPETYRAEYAPLPAATHDELHDRRDVSADEPFQKRRTCPRCQQGTLVLTEILSRKPRPPP